MASMEPSGCIKPCPPAPTRPTASQEPRNRRGIEWTRLLTNTGDTGTATPKAALSDADLASCDREGTTRGRSEVERRARVDLGEGGGKAWYVPNERTVFPVKKDMRGRESEREKRKEVVVVVEEGVDADDVLWGTTEREVKCAIRRGEEVEGKGSRLRTRRSLEEDILGIEDEESRRLTAIAYLS